MPRPAEHLPLQLGTFFLPTLYVAWFRVKEPQPMGVRESDSLIMGGLLVATVLTFFLPALYVAWFRVKEPQPLLTP
jgi:predicted permease